MMFRRSLLLFFFLIPGAQPVWTDDVPVAPIASVAHPDWGEVYEISARGLRFMISTDAGAVVSVKHQLSGEWLKAPLRIRASEEPLPDEIEKKAWENRAWRTSEGRQVVMLSRSLPPPFSFRIVHLFELAADGGSFRQLTRITATGPADPGLLNPQLEMALSPPDRVAGMGNQRLLTHGELLSFWRAEWEVETPRFPLDMVLKQEKTPESLKISGSPASLPPLPLQGWTLLCSLELKWGPAGEFDVPPSPVDAE